ncbi:MAG: carbohydrate ABC transporter permease [Clostridia bacterium]|nr:carbohydrate ABC transporter permease [Clostridia bacterium]
MKKKFRIVKKRVNRSAAGSAFIFIIVLIFALFTALPLVYAISNSLKPLNELFRFPPLLFPIHPTLKNFSDLGEVLDTSWVPMTRYLFNTVFITVAGTAGQIIFASMAAYPLAKMKFPGKNFIFQMIFVSLMFNTSVTAIPSFIIMSNLNWIDTYWALIIPAFGSSFGMYLMKNFMEQINDAIIEAAKIDGASELRVFFQIVMPQVKSAWLTMIIFSVQALWNMGSTTYIYREELKTLVYALGQISASGIARAGVASAIAVVMLVVPVTVFIITQSNIIETMSSAGVKE